MGFAVLLAGGDDPSRELLSGVGEAQLVVAADGAVRIARAQGLPIHAVVGDLDSVAAGDVAWAQAEGAEIVEFPADKDLTDLELAMAHAEQTPGIDRIVVLAVEGGRLDHEMGNWAVCCRCWEVPVDVHTNRASIAILHGSGRNEVEIDGKPGDIVSLIARGGSAKGVEASGLRWPLTDAVLEPDSSLGISNEFIDPVAKVSVDEGVLLVVRPGVSPIN